MPSHFVQGLQLAAALLAPVVTTLFFRARALASARKVEHGRGARAQSMYAGHLGFALGAYSFRRTIPLWLVLIASQLPDWLDAGMCMASINRGPYGLYTHGIAAVTIGAVAFGVLAWLVTRDLAGALLVAGVVLSHYLLDYFTGLKPTWSGGPIIGLYLYGRPLVDLALESAVVIVGWLLYRRTFPASVRDDGMVYATLFALIALQLVAGAFFAFSLGSHAKC